MERILLVMASPQGRDAAEALRSAVGAAAAPEALSLGVLTDSVRGLPDAGEAADLRTAPFGDPWKQVFSLWQGETWILLGVPEMRFERRWDRALTREAERWQERAAAGAVLTGCLPSEADPVRAVAPVAAERFDWQGKLVQVPGVPLRYAAQSRPGALIHPGFCFARAAFFREAAEADCDLFWTAFRGRWAVMTLGEPLIGLTQSRPLPTVSAPEDDADGRLRFARHFGVDFDRKTVSAKAQEGVWGPGAEDPARVPLAVRLQEGIRFLGSIRSRLAPLAVTCRLGMPERAEASAVEPARFRRLASLKNLPLCAFADRAGRPSTAKLCADTLDYSPRFGLPTFVPLDNLNKEAYLALSVPFLLRAAREEHEGRTHFLWLDSDVLRWPVYARMAFDWETICGERVTVAVVDGRPDLSAVCVPEALVLPLCRAVQDVCDRISAGTGSLPDPAAAWSALMEEQPGLFDPVELPAPRELFTLTMPSRDEEW